MSAIKLKNKIYIVLIAIVLIVIAIVAILLINNSASRVVITNDKEEKVMNTNALTMMYETEAGSGEYQVSSDTTWPQEGYVFNERLSGCENGSKLTWDDERKAVILSTTVSDKCYVYFDVYIPKLTDVCTSGTNLSSCIAEFNTLAGDGVEELYYHDGVGTYTNVDQEAKDYSYRFSGANPNNYVCFGSDEATCPADNLYRIIGVFGDQVKLIKNTSIGDYYWSGSRLNENYNTWSSSTLNTETLNGTYLNGLESTWSSKIATTNWKVGGLDIESAIYSPTKTVYNYEINNPSNSSGETTYEAKIGLMYISDFRYAASPDYWTTSLFEARASDWMFIGINEWTITRSSDSADFVFCVGATHCIRQTTLKDSSMVDFGVRPVFYLNPDVAYISGTGTESDPFRIA